jgi:hypothetical protein
MDRWVSAGCAFAIKSFYINDDSYAAARRLCCRHFQVNRNNPEPSELGLRTSRKQVRLKRKPPRKGRSICTTENIDTCFLITSYRGMGTFLDQRSRLICRLVTVFCGVTYWAKFTLIAPTILPKCSRELEKKSPESQRIYCAAWWEVYVQG